MTRRDNHILILIDAQSSSCLSRYTPLRVRHRLCRIGSGIRGPLAGLRGDGFLMPLDYGPVMGSQPERPQSPREEEAIFVGELPHGWKARKWKSFSNLSTGKLAGWPDQRTKVGKEALKAIKALPLRPSTYGPCDEIGFPSSLSYSRSDGSRGSVGLGFMSTLLVGWIEDVFYVSLPDEGKRRTGLERDGYTVEGVLWEPLPGMEHILKEEADLEYARHKAKVAADQVPS